LGRTAAELDRLAVHREPENVAAVLAVVARPVHKRDLVARLGQPARVARAIEVARAMPLELDVARAALLVGALDAPDRVRVRAVELLDDALDGHGLPQVELRGRMVCRSGERAQRERQ